MRVFITGASGFIGAQTTRSLLARGHEVTALVRPDDPLRRLKDSAGQCSLVAGVLGNTDAIRKALKESRPNVCIHLAWYTEPGKYLQAPENIDLLTHSMDFIKELIRAECRHLVMAGTCAEYDTDYGYLREDTPVRPASLYAASKLACCFLGRQLASTAGMSFAWARIFSPYGPQEDERRLVSAAIKALSNRQEFPSTSGAQVRDYLFVKDVADAFCLLAEKQCTGIYNISSGIPVTVRQLLETIGSLTGHGDFIRYGSLSDRSWEPPFICGDNSRLKELGWKQKYTLHQGLEETIHCLEENNHKSGIDE